MKNKATILLLASLLSSTVFAQSQEEMYFGVSISNTTFADSDEGVTVKYDKNNYKALMGKRINANISVEGQYLNFAETD
jgi:hypothetical protein